MYIIDYMLFIVPPIGVLFSFVFLALKLDKPSSMSWRTAWLLSGISMCIGVGSFLIAGYLIQQM